MAGLDTGDTGSELAGWYCVTLFPFCVGRGKGRNSWECLLVGQPAFIFIARGPEPGHPARSRDASITQTWHGWAFH